LAFWFGPVEQSTATKEVGRREPPTRIRPRELALPLLQWCHMASSRATRDIVAVGASAGGLQALQTLMAGLPADLPATVLIVLHLGNTSHLAQILGRAGHLPVKDAASGEPIQRGQVRVAPPGVHLLVHDNHLLLRRGPRENMSRPAIDPLFRSAATSLGSRVIGVVLSGALNDGTAGLKAIKRCGGQAVVQDPEDATVPDMPRSALRHGAVDHCVPVAEMAGLLARLVAEPAGETPDIPMDIKLETVMAAQELNHTAGDEQIGRLSQVSCPECHGPLWEIADGGLLRYRCQVGHAYTGEALLTAQADEIESTLWRLLRSHQDRANAARCMAERERAQRNDSLADLLQNRARDYAEDAELVRRFLEEHKSQAAPVDQPSYGPERLR
jgi:two-component system, chemotaxis family, protein-glutamate methylesterase/glutaminase